MEDILAKMDPEKKKNLINAAMKEFGDNNFKKASTNTIVQEAGISKGLLYHYFKSKDALYDYLIDFAFKSVAGPISEKIGYKERDIIKRIVMILELKLEVVSEYPALVKFSKNIYSGLDYEGVKKLIEKYHPIPLDMYYQHNIDESLFREGIDITMAVKNIQYTLEKIGDEYIGKLNAGAPVDIAVTTSEFRKYLEHFKKTYYKEEGQ